MTLRPERSPTPRLDTFVGQQKSPTLERDLGLLAFKRVWSRSWCIRCEPHVEATHTTRSTHVR